MIKILNAIEFNKVFKHGGRTEPWLIQVLLDVIVAKPSNKQVFSSFDKALNTINKAEVSKSIIFQENLDFYISKAADSLSIQGM